jgi:hypothetical protein
VHAQGKVRESGVILKSKVLRSSSHTALGLYTNFDSHWKPASTRAAVRTPFKPIKYDGKLIAPSLYPIFRTTEHMNTSIGRCPSTLSVTCAGHETLSRSRQHAENSTHLLASGIMQPKGIAQLGLRSSQREVNFVPKHKERNSLKHFGCEQGLRCTEVKKN